MAMQNFLSKISGRPGPSKEKSKEMDIAGMLLMSE